jgi:hypothetical protein
MAITVIKRPQGRVLSTSGVSAVVSDSSGTALFTDVAHGLVDGDYIYIDSDISSYNGYWYVDQQTVDTFIIKEYLTATAQAYVVAATITYYKSIYTHGWSCVHLPIVYKLKSDAWPVNGLDTAQTITTFTNYNGYTYIQAAGDIKTTGTASALEQVILSGTSVDGVYQIINWFSDTNFVIDLAYSAANVLSSGTVEYYYYNYHAKVRVYGGIAAGHTWTAQKPYELIAEIKAVPDSSGIITVSIEEILKSQINPLNNNTILDTLPNNIDAWCNFYITYAESYDDSNMYTVSEYTGSYTNDSSTFEGYAVNAILPFKSIDAGFMSDYFPYNGFGGSFSNVTDPLTPPTKFLTNFTTPKIFSGYYYDLSLIWPGLAVGYTKTDRYLNGFLLSSTVGYFAGTNDEGVSRVEIAVTGSEDRIDFNIYTGTPPINYSFDTITIDVAEDCNNQNFYLTWLNNLGGFDYWNFTARKTYSVDVTGNSVSEKNIYTNWPKSYGAFADTIKQQTSRTSNEVIRVSSQFITTQQEDAIKQILSSPLVQEVTSKRDRRTVIIDPTTYRIRKDQDDLRTISFDLRYTDDIPSQSL